MAAGEEGDYSEREEALYFFKYRFLEVGKWSLSCFKEKNIWNRANRSNDGSSGNFGYAVKPADTDRVVSISTVLVCTCSNVTRNISFGSN
jgi:hypothetical protein